MPLAQSIGLDTLSKYFHLPINDVAKELGVCATVLKKICRKNGISRWPHRKIKSLDKMIATLDASVAKNPEDEERIRQEIQTLKNKRTFLVKNPNVLVTAASKSPSKSSKVPLKRTKEVTNGRHNLSSFELLSTTTCTVSDEIIPVASALYSQISHPHIPRPLFPPHIGFTTSPMLAAPKLGEHEEHKSAFLKHSILQHHYDNIDDIGTQCPSSPQTPVPPSLSPSPEPQLIQDEPHAVPRATQTEFSIQLPELRIPGASEKPKLSTLEPDMFPRNPSISSTSTPPSQELPTLVQPVKWALPQWFELEHKNAMTQQILDQNS